MADLDSLLVDLESSIERGDQHSTATYRYTETRTTETRSTDTHYPRSPPGHNMTAVAPQLNTANHLNELDVLLQDLSEARYSGQMSAQETVVESRSFSSIGGGRPVQSAKLANLRSPGGLALSPAHHELHSAERAVGGAEEETEQQWEYRGYGIWDREPGDHQPQVAPPTPTRTATTGTLGFTRMETRTSSVLGTGSGRGEGAPDPGASSATAELDDLMTSLSRYNMNAGNVDEPTIGGAPNLDAMLGELQEGMTKQGVKTKQKGVCGACDKPIVGQVITALGRTWHPEHFTCNQCNQELGTQNFFERDGAPYCEGCYHHLFSPRCAGCQGAILDKCISALDQTWHPECFMCADCGVQLGDDGFHEHGDAAYCKDCYFSQFAPKCGGCQLPITESFISALNKQWHQQCFVCRQCQEPFHDGAFFEHEGFPYCETHYHALRGSLCAGCHKPISGRCITAMFRKFHPEHFVCSFCLKQLNKGTFKEQGDKPYCHECFDRLFG